MSPYTNKINSIDLLLLIILTITAFITVTGLYEIQIMPKDEILVSALCIIIIIGGYIFSQNFQFLNEKALIGFIIFNTFFIIRVFLQNEESTELKLYFTHIISLGIFLCLLSTTDIALKTAIHAKHRYIESYISIFSILVLATILIGQAIQIYSEQYTLFSRPGGYLNPNMSAAITLIFMYIIHINESKSARPQPYTILIGLSLTFIIILLSQSRSAILILIPFSAYIIYTASIMQQKISLMVLITIAIIFFSIYQSDFIELAKSISTRFEGDMSSNYRMTLLNQGWSAFLDSPIYGNGYRYLEQITIYSSHNEIIENLANFGLLGFTIILTACYFLYSPLSPTFFIVCLLPTILFTHNFFDTYAFQAALGIALAIERFRLANMNDVISRT